MVFVETYGLGLELKYDNVRLYYLRLLESSLEGRELPSDFVNVTRGRKGFLECLTLDLKKRNQKVRFLTDCSDASMWADFQRLPIATMNAFSSVRWTNIYAPFQSAH